MTGARPGWYPDPGGAAGRYRWWDGDQWTTALGDTAQAPAPASPRPVRATVRTRSDRHSAADGHSAAHRHSAAVVTIGVALIAVAGVVLGLAVWLDPNQPVDRAAVRATPKPSATGVTGELDSDTRVASIGTASMTLPGEPYRIRTDPMSAHNLFDSYFMAGAVVHDDYRDRRDWSALVGLAHVAAPAAHSDPETTAIAVAHGIAGRFFAGQPTTVRGLSVADHSVDGCSGVLLSADIGYGITGLASRFDRLSVMVVRLDDGTEVAAFSSVPSDAARDVRDKAAAALESLHAD